MVPLISVFKFARMLDFSCHGIECTTGFHALSIPGLLSLPELLFLEKGQRFQIPIFEISNLHFTGYFKFWLFVGVAQCTATRVQLIERGN